MSRICTPSPLCCSWAVLALPPALPTLHLQCLSFPNSPSAAQALPAGNGDASGLTQGREPSENPAAAEDTISLPWGREEMLPFLSEITPNKGDQPPNTSINKLTFLWSGFVGSLIQHPQNTDLLPWGLGQYLFSPSAWYFLLLLRSLLLLPLSLFKVLEGPEKE